MKIEMNSKRQVIITPETRLESAMLEAWLREAEEAVTPIVGATPSFAPVGSKYIAPAVAEDPLGLRSGYTTAANSTGSQDAQR